MLSAFQGKVRHVRFRCSANLLLEHLARGLSAAGIVAVLAVMIERFFAVELINERFSWILLAAVGISVLVLWLMDLPSRMQASLLLDDRLRLHERFSTTLALSDSDNPFAKAACSEARQRARDIRIDRHFPIRPTRRWAYAGGIWIAAIALGLLLPQKDLLGFLADRNRQQEQQEQVKEAKEDVKKDAEIVKSLVEKLGNPELTEALANLTSIPPDAKPQDIKRQAIRKLSALSDQLQKMQSGARLDSANIMNKMLKQLRSPSGALSQELSTALARGNFKQASELLQKMQEKMEQGKLSEEQKAALAKQMQELGKQLQQLAEKNAELEKELGKLGLDKKMAKMNQQQLKQALQKKGLSQQQIDQLLAKAAACQKAAGNCAGLGQAMAACGGGSGGLSGEDLAAVGEQLDQLEAVQQQLMLTQAALDQIAGACQGLGQGMCQGQGGQGGFKPGSNQNFSAGTGGAGQGYGPRSYDDTGPAGTKRTQLKTPSEKGPVIASWYFKSDQVRGEATREFSEVVEAASESAAEAISENQIPRKYEDAVKEYFGQLEKSE